MPDDKSKRSGQDRMRIDVSQAYELRDCAKKFGVSEDELKAAVHRIGDRTEAVEKYLRSNS